MIEMPGNLDEALTLFDNKSAALKEAIEACETELKGSQRTGLGLYQKAQVLGEELKTFAGQLQLQIDEELGKL